MKKIVSYMCSVVIACSCFIPVSASYMNPSFKKAGYIAVPSKIGKSCYINHPVLGSVALMGQQYADAKQEKQKFLEAVLGVHKINRAYHFFDLYSPYETYYEDQSYLPSDVPVIDGRTWVLPMIPIQEEKLKGSMIASIQMLLNYRQVFFSQEEIAKELNYNYEKGVAFNKVPAFLNQKLFGYDKPDSFMKPGYRIARLGNNRASDLKIFSDRVHNNLYEGYPLIANIAGSAAVGISNKTHSREVLVMGYLLKPGEQGGIEGVYYIEPDHNFQKLFWGGLHYLPLNEFMDAMEQGEEAAYIW